MAEAPAPSQPNGAPPPLVGETLPRPPQLAPHGPSPPFHVVSDLFQLIAEKTAPGQGRSKQGDKKRIILQKFFDQWRLRVGLDLFPVVRMLVPERDRQRPNYGLKEQALAKGYVEALNLDAKTSKAAQSLLKWKQPEGPGSWGSKGDFAQVAYDILSERSTITQGTFTVDDVNLKLDQLAAASKEGKQKILAQFYHKMSPTEQKWLIRIILKDLKISVRERTVLAVLHPDAMDLFNVCSDLQRVCYTCWKAEIRLNREDSSVGLFKAFRPMLCKRNERDLGHIVSLMTKAGGPEGKAQQDFVIEEKLDGERMQLHKKGPEYRYWSRKDKDYTYLYGKTSTEGSLTPWIDGAFYPSIEEIILDGEMLVWDPETGKTQAFGNLKTAALNPTNDPAKCRPLFRVFDVLYAKGKDNPAQNLLHKPLIARKKTLRHVFKEVPTRLECAYEVKGKTAEDIKTSLTKVLEERGEGLVVKRNDSHYVLNGREDTWIKVKPDYMDEFGETLDLIVVGGYWGQGKRGGRYGSFLCALFDDQKEGADRDDKDARWLTVCKVGSGFSYSALDEIMRKFGDRFKEWDRKNTRKNPAWLGVGHSSPEVPDTWIHPHESFVLKVKAAEIVGGESYGAGLCLRFPRCINVEWTRSYTDTMSFDEYYEIRSKSTSKRVGDDLSGHKAKKRKPNVRKKAQIISGFRGADVSSVERKSDLFDGITFFVIEGLQDDTDDGSKRALEVVIFEHGGEYVQATPISENRKVIARSADFAQVHRIIKKGNDIVHPQWVADCVAKGRLLPVSKKYLVHATDETKEGSDYDAMDADDADVTIDDDNDVRSANGTLASSPKVAPARHEWLPDVDFVAPGQARAGRDSEGEDDSGDETLDEHAGGQEDEDKEPVRPGSQGPSDFGRLQIVSPQKKRAREQETMDVDSDATDEEDEPKRQHVEAEPGLGAGTDQMDYDTEKIFKPLVFYLDTHANAEKNGVVVEAGSTEKDAAEELGRVEKELKKNGGTVTTDIMEPTLTHIVVSNRDPSRAITLVRKNTKPRRRRLVTPQWVFDSLKNGGLASEADYIPDY